MCAASIIRPIFIGGATGVICDAATGSAEALGVLGRSEDLTAAIPDNSKESS